MKKKYKRIIKGILIICLSFFLCLDANAEDDCPKESANKNITKYTVTCTVNFKEKYVKPYIDLKKCKGVVKFESRRKFKTK